MLNLPDDHECLICEMEGPEGHEAETVATTLPATPEIGPQGPPVAVAGAEIYVCGHCGCSCIQYSAWVMVNGDRITDEDGPVGNWFCPRCGDLISVIQERANWIEEHGCEPDPCLPGRCEMLS